MKLTSTQIYYIANIAVPIAVFVLNVIFRLRRQLPLTAGADWVLLLLTFDLVVLMQQPEFAPHVGSWMKEQIGPVFVLLLIFGFISWVSNVSYVEPILENATKRIWTFFGVLQVVFLLGVTLTYTWAHFYIFTSR